jgi:PAS domain S-box-containing protein
MEQALAESEQKFRTFFENEPEYCYMISPQGTILEANSAALSVLGYEKEELIGKPIESLYAPELSERVRQLLLQWKQTGEIRNEEMTIITRNGDRRTVLLSSSQVLGENGKPLHSVSIQRDITDRKKVQDELMRSEETARAFLNATTDLGLLMDREGLIIDLNDRMAKSIGGTRNEMIGKIIYDYLPPELAEQRKAKGLEIASKRKLHRFEDQREGHWFENSVYPIFDSNGEVGRFAVFSRDINDRKRWEQSIKESEEKFRSLAEQSPNMIFINKAGRIVYVNKKCEEITGYKREELYSPDFDFLTLIAPESLEMIKENFRRHSKGLEIPPYEYTIINKAGEKIVAINSSKLTEYEGQMAILGVVTDITEQKRVEKALAASELKYRSLFDNSIEGIGISSGNQIISANKALLDIFGYDSVEEFARKPILEHVAPESRKMIRWFMEKSQEGGVLPTTYEHRIICKNGQLKDIEVSTVRISKDGKQYAQSTFRDITERKRMEEAYHSLVDNSLQGLAIVQDGRIVFLNKAFYSTTDYSKEDFLNASPEQFQSIVHPDDRELVWSRHRDRLAGKPVPPRYDCRWIRKDGSTCWLELYASRIEYHGRPAIQVAYIDITERKEAEEALFKEKKFTEDTINAQIDTFFVFEAVTGKAIRWNKAFTDISGYTDEEIAGMPAPASYYSPEDLERTEAFIQMVMKEGAGTIELELICNDGRKVPTEYRVSIISDDQGEQKYFISIGRDITERKRAEEAMKKSSIIIDSTADAVITTDIAGNITFWNKGAEVIYGYRKEEAIGKPVSILYKEEDLHVLEAMIADLLEGKDIPGIEATCIDKNQQDVEILLSLTSVRDEDGNITELVGITKDITERKKSEEEIERIFNMTDYMICIAGLNGYFKRINSSFEQILGYSSEELLNKPFFDFIHPDDIEKTKTVVEEKLSSGCQVIGFENRYRCKDGSYKWLSWTSRPVVDEGIMYSIAYDVTDRKKAQEKLLEYQRQLKSLASELLLAEERERRRIATGVHDDIGQKLALAKLELQSMNEIVSEPDVSASLGHACELVDKAMQDARSLAFDLSNPVLYEVGFVAAVESLLTEQMIRKSGIKSEFKSKTRKLKLGQDMSIVLFQAVRELLTNVVKHAKAHEVKVCIDKSDNRVHVIVEDDGAGFELSKLQSPDRKKEGFGLFNVKERLEYLGGSFDIKSKPRQGTRVTMTVPL